MRDVYVLADFVLDVLKYDVAEQLVNVRTMLNSQGSVGWRLNWPADFTEAEIIAALKHLIQQGFVEVLEEDLVTTPDPAQLTDQQWHDCWYGMTDLGRKHLKDWEPPPRVGYDELP